MENREQMINVAVNCIGYERAGRIASSCEIDKAYKTCLNCCHCAGNICNKDLFEYTLTAID